MTEVRIVGFSLLDDEPWDSGDRLLGRFDYELSCGLRLNGYSLIKDARGYFISQAPRVIGMSSALKSVVITDLQLKKAITNAAHAIYVACGGAYAEFSPVARRGSDAN